jgi:hypothetical protein
MTAASSVVRFRKRPVVVEAAQLTRENAAEVWQWVAPAVEDGQALDVAIDIDSGLTVKTLEGDMRASFGDWVVKGVAGEFHPVREDIFARTYDRADALEGKTPGHAVHEANQAFMIRCFPGIRPIGWGELSEEGQAEWEGIARAGIAAYIEANGRDPVDAASVIAEAIVPELAAERKRAAGAVAELTALAGSFGTAVRDAADAERKRIRELADRTGAVCAGDEGTSFYFSALLADKPEEVPGA